MKKVMNAGLICVLSVALLSGAQGDRSAHIRVNDGIIAFFPDQPADAVIARKRIGGENLWAGGVRRDGKTRQVRITSYVGGRGAKPSLVRLRYPFGEASATWNMAVKRAGDIVSVMLPWNGTLIGDVMDVNEGEDAAEEARRRLGTTTAAESGLPVLYSSGDSISMGYWPYLEGELHDTVDVYYQRELAKDVPDIGLRNNGHAHLAYGVLQTAYRNPRFRPDTILINFGLHMIATHHNKVQQYGAWIERFAALAKANGPRMIWVNTTPYQQSFRPRQNETIKAFNAVAAEVAARHGVPVVDLYACVLEQVRASGDKAVFTDGVHFTEDMKKRQAACIAERVREQWGSSALHDAPPAERRATQ
jgi:lysophospholipase L1-like esterase